MKQYQLLNQYLEEKIQIQMSPVNLKEIDKVEGLPIYTSDKLKSYYINIIKDSQLLKPVMDVILKLVNNNSIIPCYLSKNILHFLLNKLIITSVGGGVVAFYYPKTNRVYSTLEMQTSVIMNIKSNFISSVLFHELQHYAAANINSKQYSLFSSMYNNWYKHFFNILFNTKKIKADDLKNITKFLSKNEINNDMWKRPEKFVNIYSRLINKEIISKYNIDIKENLLDFTISLTQYLRDPNNYLRLVIGKKSPYIDIHWFCIEAYKKMSYNINSTIAIQELFLPSEIACITCQKKPLPIHYKAIKMLSSIK